MKKLLLINIAGFASNGQNKSDQLQTMFPDARVLNFTTSGKDPYKLVDDILEAVKVYRGEHPILVGSSLGGFYAYIVASFLDCHAILINPSLKPWETLEPKKGENNMFNGKTFELTSAHLLGMSRWYDRRKDDLETQYLAVFTGSRDDVLNHAYTDEVIPYPMIRCEMSGYDHRFADISIIESCIKLMQKEGAKYNAECGGESEPFDWFD